MDTALLVVTIASLAVAAVMSVLAWRVSRAERQRSEARIAALAAAADEANAPRLVGRRAPWSAPVPAPPGPGPGARRREPRAFLEAASGAASDGGRQRALAVGAALLIAALGAAGARMFAGGSGRALAPHTLETNAAAISTHAPLELLSLSHERAGTRLTVRGLVRNPARGRPVDDLEAVLFLFDEGGTFVTSARAGVEFRRLGPGDETPFVLTAEAPPSAARYRVSFRASDVVVPHVDRREAP
ncbi:MAG: hypothetical protein AB1635_11695 [Acidobacteriota bacterium]